MLDAIGPQQAKLELKTTSRPNQLKYEINRKLRSDNKRVPDEIQIFPDRFHNNVRILC